MFKGTRKIQELTVKYFKNIDTHGQEKVDNCVRLANATRWTYQYYLSLPDDQFNAAMMKCFPNEH